MYARVCSCQWRVPESPKMDKLAYLTAKLFESGVTFRFAMASKAVWNCGQTEFATLIVGHAYIQLCVCMCVTAFTWGFAHVVISFLAH